VKLKQKKTVTFCIGAFDLRSYAALRKCMESVLVDA